MASYMDHFSHIVEVDEKRKCIVVHRQFDDGKKDLLFEFYLPLKTAREEKKWFDELVDNFGLSMLCDMHFVREYMDLASLGEESESDSEENVKSDLEILEENEADFLAVNKLIGNWMAYITSEEDSPARKKCSWAHEKLMRLCKDDPYEGLRIVRVMCTLFEKDEALVKIATGPFEDLLVRHGREIIDGLRKWAREEYKYIKILATVRNSGMDDEVWGVLKRITNGIGSL
ncbi:MAG: hypothetical protein CMN56_11495 [Sneathiella sp.]|uniref:DUF6869 domain-containing protein n=1 Tax=Sneathiella sp. TaxID=1964365 RepID=UPI000C4889C5|nr:hypothetical protein [Sneathiella sp.]MAZ03750.1 hypothetical protein [Sneathiella sp.]